MLQPSQGRRAARYPHRAVAIRRQAPLDQFQQGIVVLDNENQIGRRAGRLARVHCLVFLLEDRRHDAISRLPVLDVGAREYAWQDSNLRPTV